MNISFIVRVIVAAAAVTSSVAAYAAKEPIRLEPISKWEVNYADDSCRMARKFGDTDQYGTVIFDRYGPGDSLNITLAGPVFKKIGSSEVLDIKFGPNEDVQNGPFFVGTIGETIPTLVLRGSYRIGPFTKAEQREIKNNKDNPDYQSPIVGPEREASVSDLTILRPLRQPVQLSLGSMKAPFSAMNKCVENLLTFWGIDIERHAKRSKSVQPTGNPGQWLNSNDYPAKMVEKSQPALVDFRLSIDETGKPSACHIQKSAGGKDFDDVSCKALMKRAKFNPALDEASKPLASYYLGRIVFQPS